ncbi:MAG TPA: ABC transporter permease [Vicinamibacterales bacterium]|nr:ABC transporter permease [Vicinamibacterales bacterium]
MKRILLVAQREFIATVSTKAFIVGLLIMPLMFAVIAIVFPRLINPRNYRTRGEVAIVDPSGRAVADIRAAFSPERVAERREEQARQVLNQAPQAVQQLAGSGRSNQMTAAMAGATPLPELRLVERPPTADVQKEKTWLLDQQSEPRHLALVVIHENAVVPTSGDVYGSYDTYVPASADDRAIGEIQQAMQDGLINARVREQGLDRSKLESLVRVPRGRSITVTRESERNTVRGINQMLPIAFIILMFMGVMTGGQSLLTSTVEEKSNRVMEVLLSALSPMELLAGKIVGQLGVSMVAFGLYVALGLALLLSFALFGLLNPWLILYLGIFFLLAYLTFGSLMVSVGAVVNDMREAQGLIMPIMLLLTFPFWVWFPISMSPNSAFSTALSFIPPVNTFAMLIRLTSTAPPPWWQVWLSIGIAVAGVGAALWFASKVFQIGLLMTGKPPNFATLIRWARQA